MLYRHTPEQSTELLRQALPMMSKQAAALHPMSYALWYAYVSDERSPLRQEVDQLLARLGKLDEASTQALYHRHVADMDPATLARVSDGLNKVIGGMTAQTALAGNQTEEYGQALERMAAKLGNTASMAEQPAAPGMLDELMGHTQQMRGHLTQLQKQLAESRREIDMLREEVNSARQDSLLDTLTGLANRRAFDRRLAEIEVNGLVTQLDNGTSHGPVTCLLVADLDHFKRINDTYGHGFGDQVLKAVGQLLRSITPESALAARVGGEEFAVLLPDTSMDGAQALAERLRATVAANQIRRKGQQGAAEHVTLSLGVTAWRPGDSPQTFFERADRALYSAKAGGRDRVALG